MIAKKEGGGYPPPIVEVTRAVGGSTREGGIGEQKQGWFAPHKHYTTNMSYNINKGGNAMDCQQAVKQVLQMLAGQQNVLVVPRGLVDFVGSIEGAILLNQMLYWSSRTEDGEFWKTYEQWREETSLSQYQVRKYVKQFQDMGFLEVSFKKENGTPVLHYKLDIDKLLHKISEVLTSQARPLKNYKVDLKKTTRLTLKKLQGPIYIHRLQTKTTNKNICTHNRNEQNSQVPQNVPLIEALSLTRIPQKRAGRGKEQPPKLDAIQKDRFEEFWKLYPRKRNKYDAMRAWEVIEPDSELFEQIMSGLRKAVNSKEWKEQDGRYIPYPATWLRKYRWLDEYTENEEHFDRWEVLLAQRKQGGKTL